MTDKENLEASLIRAEAELAEKQARVTEIKLALRRIVDAEQKAREKANSGTRIEEVLDRGVVKFRIARGAYLEDPKYFDFYSSGDPVWSRYRCSGRIYETREKAEEGLVELRQAEKEIRAERKAAKKQESGQ